MLFRPSSFFVSLLFEGIIWFLLPTALVIVNDIMAYLAGVRGGCGWCGVVGSARVGCCGGNTLCCIACTMRCRLPTCPCQQHQDSPGRGVWLWLVWGGGVRAGCLLVPLPPPHSQLGRGVGSRGSPLLPLCWGGRGAGRRKRGKGEGGRWPKGRQGSLLPHLLALATSGRKIPPFHFVSLIAGIQEYSRFSLFCIANALPPSWAGWVIPLAIGHGPNTSVT